MLDSLPNNVYDGVLVISNVAIVSEAIVIIQINFIFTNLSLVNLSFNETIYS